MELNKIDDIKSEIEEHSNNLEEKAKGQLNEIIEKLPDFKKDLIEEAFQYKRIPKEYLLSSILFAFSNAAGLAFEFNALGYSNYGNLYFALIGSRGDMKSPAMELATAPLNKIDTEKYNEYKEEVKDAGPENPYVRKQILIQDATIEAANRAHYQNPYSIGIYVDELYHLIEKMGNPSSKDGPAWRTFLLQGNTNKHIDIIRKTTESFRLSKSYPVLLGSIQTEFIPKIFSGGNLESGLVDRMFFTTKLTDNDTLLRHNISSDCLKNYSDNLLSLMRFRNGIEGSNYDGESLNVHCTKEAEDALFNYCQNLINIQKKAPFMEKEYIAKLQINIHKVVLLLHLIKQSESGDYRIKVDAQTVEEAILICDFYFTNYKIIISQLNGKKQEKVSTESIIKVGMKNNATQVAIANVLGVDKATICRQMKKIKLAMQPATRNLA